MRYVRGLLKSVPMLQAMVERATGDSISLRQRVTIETHTASFRTTRGYSIVAALLDELAFWPTDEGSAEPDTEVIAAIRPGMASVPGAMLLCASSPYARRGALWEAYRRYFGKDEGVLIWQAPTRQMNPTIPEFVVNEAMERDPASAQAEYLAQFRSDIEGFVLREVVDACISRGIYECPPEPGLKYCAFVDPSGGSSDSFTLAIAHRDANQLILDALREVRAPFSPEAVVSEFAVVLKSYCVSKVGGDRYAGQWPREQFRKYGVRYEPSERAKSDLYRDLLPLLNSRRCELLDHPRLLNQLVSLERRTSRAGRDSIDHPPGAHDDLANCVAGALLNAFDVRKGRALFSTYSQYADDMWHPVYEVTPDGLVEIDRKTLQPVQRTRIRFVKLSEQEAPAVRGSKHALYQ